MTRIDLPDGWHWYKEPRKQRPYARPEESTPGLYYFICYIKDGIVTACKGYGNMLSAVSYINAGDNPSYDPCNSGKAHMKEIEEYWGVQIHDEMVSFLYPETKENYEHLLSEEFTQFINLGD